MAVNSRTADKQKNSKKAVLASKIQNPPKKKVESIIGKKSQLPLDKNLAILIYKNMLKARILEERLIKIYRVGESYFWIGGPGEEAWGVPLGLLVNKGRGLNFDWLHLHYRCTPTLIAMGMPMIESIRMMMNRATDQSTGGRNFCNHYCFPEWNVAPVTSPIEVQYPIACGTAHAQKRIQNGGITIVSGGDAGTAEGDFASCLVWASRKGSELPMLITVQNNKWGISTNFDGQHGEAQIADRGRAFGMRTRVINGNDPVETYLILKEELEYIRKNKKPVLMEALVSRLYGHSSATGANYVSEEVDCLREFEQKLFKLDLLKESEQLTWTKEFEDEGVRAANQVRSEMPPLPESIWDHVYVNNENADWRKF